MIETLAPRGRVRKQTKRMFFKFIFSGVQSYCRPVYNLTAVELQKISMTVYQGVLRLQLRDGMWDGSHDSVSKETTWIIRYLSC